MSKESVTHAIKREDGTYSLEIIGYVCPYSLLLTLKALDKLKPKDILDVILDNVPTAESLPSTVEQKGYKVLNVNKIDNTKWKITIEK